MTPPVTLTIAGSDSGAGAGIQADLKAFAAHGCFGTCAITAVTAQNTRGVTDVHPVPVATVASQVAAVLDDLPVAAVKTGMLGSAEIADHLADLAAVGRLPHLVVDPVLVSTTGYELGVVEAIERLLPYALVVTPNVAEAAALTGRPVTTPEEMVRAATALGERGTRYVVVTGGDLPDPTDEVVEAVWTDGKVELLSGPRVDSRHSHGSGCTFSAALTAHLAKGASVMEAILAAKAYVGRAMAGAVDWRLGGGAGPLDHFEWSTSAGTGPARPMAGEGVG